MRKLFFLTPLLFIRNMQSFHVGTMFGMTNRTFFMQMRTKKTKSETDLISPTQSKTRIRHNTPNYLPKTPNQALYVNHLNDLNTPIVFGIGPAGCGKTLFACVTAINNLKKGLVKKIVLTRPIVPVDKEEMGFLPGNLVSKMDPWTRPIFDIFTEFYPQKEIESMVHSGVIEVSPLAFMRGRTFKDSFIIADEMQNSSPNQMLMLTTRIGDGSKMVITGDLKQTDRSDENGLLDIMHKVFIYNSYESQKKEPSNLGIQIVHMTSQDIERSPIVSKILDIYSVKPKEAVVPTFKNESIVLNTENKKSVSYTISNSDAALIPIHHSTKRTMI